MLEGVVIRGIAGFYYVKAEDLNEYECKARGKFRKEKISPVVGDRVIFELTDNKHGIITEIKERKSFLIRPNVANVDQAIVVFSSKNPSPNLNLLDRLLVTIEHNNIEAILCMNKLDLDEEGLYNKIQSIYSKAGYKIINTCGVNNIGIDEINKNLTGKISVFAGPSGVGKSTIFNQLQDKIKMETGDVSLKANRGKHTTRHAELVEIEKGTYLVDTPGFSSIDLKYIKPEELQFDFKEFEPYIGMCKFNSCLHLKEIGCKVKEKVNDGTISKERYESYTDILKEIRNLRRGYYGD